MTIVSTVPFNKIKALDEINARPKGRDGIDELAASIKARGVIQPLAVRPNDQDHYEVIDGRRRFMAIGRLVKAGDWEKTAMVPVLIRHEDDAEALETSLIANTVRLPMHPVDQHDVFARLVDQGREPAQIAADFGVTEKTVRQQLALGKLAPEVRKAWKAGKIDAPSAQAFTTADPTQQAAILKRLSSVYHGVTADAVRRELRTDRPAVKDVEPAVLALYLAAGGTVADDLFSDARYTWLAPGYGMLSFRKLN